MDAKQIFLKSEGNAFFLRNREAADKIEEAGYAGYPMIRDFLRQHGIYGKEHKLLEVGSSFGYNLRYLTRHLDGLQAYGIEPSGMAVEEGNKRGGVTLIQGTADSLPFEDASFDVVVMGFCLFWVDRKYLFRSVAEADRVLKEDGYLVVYDFDTRNPYIRDNIHQKDCFTFKMDYAQMFLANPQYYMVLKRAFAHKDAEMNYVKDIQERISVQILHKDTVQNTYFKG